MVCQTLDETLSAAGVGVAAIHEAVQVNIFKTVFLGNVTQSLDMLKRRVHTTGRGQPHQMERLTVFLAI